MRIELTEDPTAFHTADWTDVVMGDPHGTFFHTPAYLKLKKAEWNEFARHLTQWERDVTLDC